MSEDGGECPECDKYFPTDKALDQHLRDKHNAFLLHDSDMKPDWSNTCDTCGEAPIVPITGLCGPCTWGEAATRGGNW